MARLAREVLLARSPSVAGVMVIAMFVMMRRAGRVCMRVSQRGVVVLGVVLAQEIAAVIVAIGRAHDSMDVVARWLVVVVDDARLVVEFDEDYRREDAVIEGAMVVDSADPGKMSSVEMALHLGPATLGMARPNAPGIDAEQCFEAFAAFTRQVRIADAGRLDATIILECGGQQLAWQVLADRRLLPLKIR